MRRGRAAARRSLALSPVVVSVLLAGCGGKSDESTVGTAQPAQTATTPPTASSPPAATSPPAAAGPDAPEGTTQSGGGEEPVRAPVTFVFRAGGGVDPPTVTVPAFVAVELTLASRDGRAHVLRFNDGRRSYRLAVGAGRRETTKLPGLRAGSYRLMAFGGGRGATLVVGGEAGP